MLFRGETRVPASVPTLTKGTAQEMITKELKKDLQGSVRLPEEDVRRWQVPSRVIGLDAGTDKKPEK